MPQTFLSPDLLYDRPWRPGHPFSPNPSAKRRWTMLLLLILLCAIIGGYLFITDARRVKILAESELSRLVGGPVTVGRATLSLFEGLRLENVQVHVDGGEETDSVVFSANTFLVNYDLRALFAGRLKLTQIVAIDPHVQLTENLDTGRWNYQRMRPAPSSTSKPAKPGPMPTLPEIILRNARIDYAERRGGKQMSRASMAIEGQLAPSSDGQRYTFEMQSRGDGPEAQVTRGTSVGPTIQGVLVRNTGQITAKLTDFRFGQDIRSMLPAQVRAWWDRHKLAGAVDIPVLAYTPDPSGGEPKFRVETVFKGVALTIQPEEWMSRDESRAQRWAAGAFDAMSRAGLNSNGVVDQLAALIAPSPVQLEDVRGGFEFTERGIVLKGVAGTLEQSEFAIDGHIDGYSPLSPAHISINSDHAEIPRQPRYITSMPPPVRELYDHLRPVGVCTVQISLDRPQLGARLDVAGEIAIINGGFVFDRFPYPVRAATGKIVMGFDPSTGMDFVKLVGLQGMGAKGGPNENSVIKLGGLISPLTADVGVQVTVSSDDVRNEPLLSASFPPEVRQALRNMDADGKGVYPTYHGGFECRVVRPIGPRSIWLIETDITLFDAAGKMVAFPYFMEHVTGKLEIREGYLDILKASMKKGDSSLVIDGRVTWRAGIGGRPLEPGEVAGQVTPARPDLKITARNVPIDQSLLDAMPQDRRTWLQKVGLAGLLDIDGRVWRPNAAEAKSTARSASDSELTHAFDLTLRNGSIWPIEGTFALANLAGKLRLLPDRLIIQEMSAKRGDADLTGHGEVSWPDNRPNVAFSGSASKLQLDRTLYSILPAAAQAGWDEVKPEGTVDVDLSYRGAVAVVAHTTQPNTTHPVEAIAAGAPTTAPSIASNVTPAAASTTAASSAQNIDLTIRPVKLCATIRSIPYRLDDLTGTVRINEGKVLLTEVTGKHGEGTIRISGGGLVDKTDWDLRLSGERITVDETFRKALPAGLGWLIDSIKMTGVIGFDFPKLQIRTAADFVAVNRTTASSATADASGEHTTAKPIATTHAATTSPQSTPLDVDFAVRLAMDNASMELGVPMAQVKGKLELDGTVRSGKLAALNGPLDFSSLTIAGRPGRDLHAEFYKPADADALRVGKITGQLADGDMAGQVDLSFPDTTPGRYIVGLVLRNADLRELSGQLEPDLSGELSASFALEGEWGNPASRRGRGDVAVSGKEMYKIPLVLGLLQITNLSLPISSPFNEGSARYLISGPTVTFESLELRSHDMLMSGSGQLDFDTKKVRMSFTTDNPNWPKVPIVGDLLQSAKHELLQIHVKGTLEDPKVSAAAINTFTTTVDEVLRGDGKK